MFRHLLCNTNLTLLLILMNPIANFRHKDFNLAIGSIHIKICDHFIRTIL